MSLKVLSFQHEYRSDKTNLIDDFYTPCLKNATKYCRAVAYFTSNGLQLNVDGLSSFIQNGGQMNLVTGPKLMEDDIEAIRQGYKLREDKIDDVLNCDFEEVWQNRLLLLTWLIAHRNLDIKIACPSDLNSSYQQAIYHEKTGVFLDDNNNAVAFSGSSNETVGGLLNNFESIDVHWSWSDAQERVQQKINNFHRLWDNKTDRLKVVDFQEAFSDDLLIRQTVYEIEGDSTDESQEIDESSATYLPDGVKLRDYQVEAIEAWFNNDCKGIWEMATGTGKTITALSALARLREEKKRLFVLIVCPYQHLVDQWNKVAILYGFRPILAYKSSKKWTAQWADGLSLYNWFVENNMCVITTHSTFGRTMMQNLLSIPKIANSVLVGDEVHHFGAQHSRDKLSEVFDYRLGLSATPNRWFDVVGTEAIKSYFGNTIYEFSLNEAIKNGYLSQYYYYPHLVELTDTEFEKYEVISKKISKLHFSVDQDQKNKVLEQLMIKRARLLNRAENKLSILRELILNQVDTIHHSLFYCAHGGIEPVFTLLEELGLRIAKFTAEVPTDERRVLLDRFASGDLQALVAMKCLDEGVDVPSTQTAYILASSSNPKEFIQRRGRILRQYSGKKFAEIHDLITIPPLKYRQFSNSTFDTERKIIERELSRFAEFSKSALNEFSARDKIWKIAKEYNLIDVF